MDRVFANFQGAANWPILMTASLIVTCCTQGKGVWQYLDDFEAGLEAADNIQLHVVPAVILQARRPTRGSETERHGRLERIVPSRNMALILCELGPPHRRYRVCSGQIRFRRGL